MFGGAISGYSETGSAVKAMAPTMTVTIDRTEAKIGRSTKKWAKRMVRSVRRCRRLRTFARRRQSDRLGRHLAAEARALNAGDDDRFVARQASADDAISIVARTGPNNSLAHRPIGGHDIDKPPLEVGDYRFVGNKYRLVKWASGNGETPEHARGQEIIEVIEHGAATHRSGRRIEPVVDEVDAPLA